MTTAAMGVHTSNRVTAWVGSRAAHQVQVAVDDGMLDDFVFLGSPAEILAGDTALTGRPPVPPDWSFGWWQSRCSYASAEEVLEVVREMREAGIPMDVIHPDTNWFAVDVAPFQAAGRAELRVPMDGRDVTIRYEAEAGRHTVEAAGRLGEVVLDAPPVVEVRR